MLIKISPFLFCYNSRPWIPGILRECSKSTLFSSVVCSFCSPPPAAAAAAAACCCCRRRRLLLLPPPPPGAAAARSKVVGLSLEVAVRVRAGVCVGECLAGCVCVCVSDPISLHAVMWWEGGPVDGRT
jgi:hypothetical protein